MEGRPGESDPAGHPRPWDAGEAVGERLLVRKVFLPAPQRARVLKPRLEFGSQPRARHRPCRNASQKQSGDEHPCEPYHSASSGTSRVTT